MDNKNQPNDNSSQNELDLGFNHSDSVTPRKTIQQSGSIFDKAKGLFGKKQQADTQFHVRREPTFGAATSQPFSPSQTFQSENVEQVAQASAFSPQEPVENVQVENVAEEKVIFENSPTEEVVEDATTQAETVAPAAAASLKSPEKWKVLQMLPEKHRRLFIAILGLVVLLIIFFTLKPNSDTVESFEQQNGNEIPVQFQSLDQSQPVETTVLDNNNTTAPATTEQTANAAKSDTPPAMEYVGDKADAAKSQPVEPAQQTVAQQPATQPAPVQPAVAPAPVKEPVKTVQPTVEKHTATVEHKAEPRREQTSVVQEKKQPKPVAEKATVQPTQTVKKESSKIQEAKPVATKDSKVQIVEAKSATHNTVKAAEPAAQTASTGATKTLTVPQGVSLMQVFRDNKLNISDVNAMTKASGAGNALSNFKPGDKVQVSVNSQGRVSELRLSNGGKFIRQADGSYQYKK
ncbi:opacity-associated protein OapA [Haemophilus parainfluenzae]|mgnify:CR=1 FL=1|uniref:Acetylglucosamine transferase n=1 Tax=Haemophilus parainfluenzae TaxID=729 RepID=A0AB36IQ16_HAEPA|nr:opacity-associated protein OapA [Haemophilus parainfluenzae]MDU1945675.1 opacity-associated protein OapA [Haemophilus parainfluenzae]MDU2038420.1 opacity-associated protein OapA [Haemophilus parainfluenzae]OLV27165.1 acetylglucosamine transferase [Haemophilus parainfluenzae]